MGKNINLQRGGTAQVLSCDGESAVVSSPLPFPPGATLAGSVEGVETAFELKVRSCRREGDAFRVEGRLRNATRELKAAVSIAP